MNQLDQSTIEDEAKRYWIMRIIQYIKKPYDIILRLQGLGFGSLIPDSMYIRCAFREMTGNRLHLKHPITFSEKLQWLKLHDRKPLYTTLVDKYAAKEYVGGLIGTKYIIPTIGIWNTFDEIDFDHLPNQFVLKCTHDSGGAFICRDKKSLNLAEAREKMMRSLNTDYYLLGREWPYKDVPRRIIAEEYMEDHNTKEYQFTGIKELKDYKFYCFHGIPTYCQVISNRYTAETIDFFDMHWKYVDFTGLSVPHKPHSILPIDPPDCFEEMKMIAAKLSKEIPFVRVDLYSIHNSVFFGEMTLYPASGFGYFTPEEYNVKLGKMIDISYCYQK